MQDYFNSGRLTGLQTTHPVTPSGVPPHVFASSSTSLEGNSACFRMHSNQAIRVTGYSPEGARYDSDGRSPSGIEAIITSREAA